MSCISVRCAVQCPHAGAEGCAQPGSAVSSSVGTGTSSAHVPKGCCPYHPVLGAQLGLGRSLALVAPFWWLFLCFCISHCCMDVNRSQLPILYFCVCCWKESRALFAQRSFPPCCQLSEGTCGAPIGPVLFRVPTFILLMYFMSDSLDSSHRAAAPCSQDSLSNSRYSRAAEPCFAFSCCSFPLQRDAALQSAPDHKKAKLSFACRAQLPRDAESRARRAAPSPSQLPVFYSCLFGSYIWKIINLNVLWFCSSAMSC